MGIKDAFEAAEWHQLLALPYVAGTAVVMAAPSGPLGLFHEAAALAKAPLQAAQQSQGNPLVSALGVDAQNQAQSLLKEAQSGFKGLNPQQVGAKAVESCKAAAELLAKATPDDAAAYRAWVSTVATAVAGAAKDGGQPISASEQALLDDMSAALGDQPQSA